MGLFGDAVESAISGIFGGSSPAPQSGGTSNCTYGGLVDSLFGPKSESQPFGTTISSRHKTFSSRQEAIDDLDSSDVNRGICGDLGCKCPKCDYFCGSRGALVQHFEESHRDDILLVAKYLQDSVL